MICIYIVDIQIYFYQAYKNPLLLKKIRNSLMSEVHVTAKTR